MSMNKKQNWTVIDILDDWKVERVLQNTYNLENDRMKWADREAEGRVSTHCSIACATVNVAAGLRPIDRSEISGKRNS